MWPRVNGMRSIELGTRGAMRAELNALVLAGTKTTTTGLLGDYAKETEGLEYPGERLALLDDEGRYVATVEITDAEVTSFAGVTWAHADAEGEGFTSLADWRTGHRRYWAEQGTPVTDETLVVCLAFRLTQAEA
ncbi:ASCH domain-containing protein [Streptomyces aureoverticillatus]|nr:ASCH domain-containing protein [Streptomyces aureoverticillatus]